MVTSGSVDFDSLTVGAVYDPGADDAWLDFASRDLNFPLKDQLVRRLRRLGRELTGQLRFAKTACPFCGGRTDIVDRLEIAAEETGEDEGSESLASFELCRRCVYWRWHFVDSEFQFRGGEYAYQYTSFASKLQEFNADLPEGCAVDLAQWLRRRPDYWLRLSPPGMERFVAEVFRANYGDADVMHVGRSRDGGVDVVMVRHSGERWLIQVKRRGERTAGRAEPVQTLRELIGTMTLRGARMGAVVTTADHFSYDAYVEAKRGREIGFVVELVDRRKLDEMVGRLLPRDPWVRALGSRFALYGAWLQHQLRRPIGDMPPAHEKPTRVTVITTERRLLLDYQGNVTPLRLVDSSDAPATVDERQLDMFASNLESTE